MQGRVLIIAGSDSGGGAGIQADIKTITALNGFAMSAISVLTAQNTLGVHGIHNIPADFVVRQIEVVLEDIGADAIKIGMLQRRDVIEAVADVLERLAPETPLVLDPVMVAKGGHVLLESDAMSVLKERLIPMAGLLIPNVPEAEALSGLKIKTHDDFGVLGAALLDLGAGAVLLKGGHMNAAQLTDVLCRTGHEDVTFSSARLRTPHTHGTGCTLASATACGLAQGLDLVAAFKRAHAYVQEAIRTAPRYGHGHGPLNHAHCVRPFPK